MVSCWQFFYTVCEQYLSFHFTLQHPLAWTGSSLLQATQPIYSQVTNVLPGDPAATARLFFFYVALSCYCVNVSIRNTPTQALCLRSSKLLATVQLKTSSDASKGRWLSHLPGKTFASQHHTSHIHTETIRLTRHTSGYFVFFPIITPDAVAQVGWQIILSPHT